MPSGRVLQRVLPTHPKRGRELAIRTVFNHRKQKKQTITLAPITVEEAQQTASRAAHRVNYSHYSRERESAHSVKRVQDAVGEWVQKTGQRPTAVELIAAELLTTPLDKPRELAQFVTTMKSIFMHHRTEVNWEGNPSHAYVATHTIVPQTSRSLLESVEGIIHYSTNKIVSTEQISRELGLTKKTNGALDAALQILEKARFIECVSRGRDGKSSRFRWKRYGNTIQPHEIGGPRYQLLERLSSGRIWIADLITRGGIKRRATTDIYQILKIMLKNQLIQIERERTARGRPKVFVRFTPKAETLWGEHLRTGILPKPFREILFEKLYAGRSNSIKKN